MSAELISAVIPAYNAEAHIDAALRSTLAQVKPGIVDVEILVVDDGSTDGTLAKTDAVAAQYPGKVQIIRQPQNLGPAAARNAGLRRATGTFICFLDADDQYIPGFFAGGLEFLQQNPRVAAIITGVEFVNCHREIHPLQYRAIVDSIPSNVLLRTSVAHLLGGFPEDVTFRGRAASEDFCFKLALIEEFQVFRAKQKCLRYLVRPGSHFDFFLDRTEVIDGRLVFKEVTPEEASGAMAAARRAYRSAFRQRVEATALCKRLSSSPPKNA